MNWQLGEYVTRVRQGNVIVEVMNIHETFEAARILQQYWSGQFKVLHVITPRRCELVIAEPAATVETIIGIRDALYRALHEERAA